MGAKQPLTLVDRMRLTVLDERAANRGVTTWRVSYEAYMKLLGFEETFVRSLDNARDAYLFGIPIVIERDWHGETFEYDAEPY